MFGHAYFGEQYFGEQYFGETEIPPPSEDPPMYRGFAMQVDQFKAYQQLASLSTVNTFSSLVTVPATAIGMIMTAEAQAVRWTGDGTDPSASVGNLLPAGYSIDIRRSTSSSNPFSQIRAIEVTSGAKVSLQFYA